MARASDKDLKKLKAEAQSLYENGIKLTDIAKKIGKPDGTIRRWKSEGGWGSGSIKNERSQKDNGKKANVRKGKPGAPSGNTNAKGNHGGAPKWNKNAEKHGLFSKCLPDDMLDIINEIGNKSYVDILWENIQISYAAILRSQKIMFVENKKEMVKELKKVKKGKSGTEAEWEFQFSWDRQATFLTAQARAMSELRALIKQYEELATGEQKAKVAKIKAETERINNTTKDESTGIANDWIMNVIAKTQDEEGIP
ncbi:MAG: phage terminase small subunit [Prevotella sp.]|nr:phage terminase small subunit [Prevotella sp.]